MDSRLLKSICYATFDLFVTLRHKIIWQLDMVIKMQFFATAFQFYDLHAFQLLHSILTKLAVNLSKQQSLYLVSVRFLNVP